MTTSISRRSALGLMLSMVPISSGATKGADPFPAAIRRAEAADAAYRESGRLSRQIEAAGRFLPSGWRSYRAVLLQARTYARFELHTLTPTTPTEAAALVAYYRDRADACGDPAAVRAAQRRLRKVFRRPGAILPGALPQARASPD